MATAGNDDRLYVFEAFGLLLGIDDVPEAQQAQWLEAGSHNRSNLSST
jgi:exportin-T